LPDRNIVVPQSRVFGPSAGTGLRITGVELSAKVLEQAATTTLEISIENLTGAPTEAELLVPVPDNAVVHGFTFHGSGLEPSARLLPWQDARRDYEAIVAGMRDPALLEFVGCGMIRTSLFPVEARSTQKVRLVFEHMLDAQGDRIDYTFPRSESIGYTVPWRVSVEFTSTKPIATLYSPSHAVETTRLAPNRISARTRLASAAVPGAFRLSCLRAGHGMSASLFAYPDPASKGGYFLLLAGTPVKSPVSLSRPAMKREVTLVLDRSGSMQGEKIEQVRAAALQIIGALHRGEAFNLVIYNDTVDLFSRKAVIKTDDSMEQVRSYLERIDAQGGTNIHDALAESLRLEPSEDMLPIMLFLTDGLPTVGNTSEIAIRNVAMKANPHNRRIFTVGVGVDVNTPLLARIASETRAAATYVIPGEAVEAKVAQAFSRLTGPLLSDPSLLVVDAFDRPVSGRVCDVMPHRLPDLFEDDRFVVVGRYLGEGPISFQLEGNYLGSQRTFRFDFGLEKASLRNGFVPRLWASRRIGVLSDAIRQLGAVPEEPRPPSAAPPAIDGRAQELIDEIVRLSTEFGILTEYTAFLAREGIDLSHRDAIFAEANDNFQRRAMAVRSGLASVNQDFNNQAQMGQVILNPRNAIFDANMNRVEFTRIQQVNDLAFFWKEGRWVDSRIVADPAASREPKSTVLFGSPEYNALAFRLAGEGRQGSMALEGDVVLQIDGEAVLVKGAVGK